jgi:hypothetical protein
MVEGLAVKVSSDTKQGVMPVTDGRRVEAARIGTRFNVQARSGADPTPSCITRHSELYHAPLRAVSRSHVEW